MTLLQMEDHFGSYYLISVAEEWKFIIKSTNGKKR